ncbi:MAG: DUF2141 domain-containing protein [Sandaracinaceae bacterium]
MTIVGLRNDHGSLRGGLYTDPSVWLRENAASEDCRAPIRGGVARCRFHAPVSRVAFAAMHDEDDDGELDRDLLGVPSEGYAFSNDVREPFGPPSFRAASFAAPRLRVHARYGI